jgi:hypothetical protein
LFAPIHPHPPPTLSLKSGEGIKLWKKKRERERERSRRRWKSRETEITEIKDKIEGKSPERHMESAEEINKVVNRQLERATIARRRRKEQQMKDTDG